MCFSEASSSIKHEHRKAEKLTSLSLAASEAASLKFLGTRKVFAVWSPSARNPWICVSLAPP
jgi:hypothetical protein